jgi:hypothetical protein
MRVSAWPHGRDQVWRRARLAQRAQVKRRLFALHGSIARLGEIAAHVLPRQQ